MSSAHKWTDAEKAELLVAVLDSMGGTVDWNKVKLPEGRTKRACIHVLAKFKQQAGSAEKPAGKEKANGAKTSTKRKRGAKSQEQVDEDNDDEGGDDEDPASKKAKSESQQDSSNVKAEEEDSESGSVKLEKSEEADED
ncbi:hypothetical protein MMC20_007843 [Loxospora ochrophaea]|nr:hypothetical protein [Loxospora ochrophaea]